MSLIRKCATGNAALSMTVPAPAAGGELKGVYVHVGVAQGGAGNITIKYVGDSAAYTTVLYTLTMQAVTDLYISSVPAYIAPGTSLLIEWANAEGKTYGVTAVVERNSPG